MRHRTPGVILAAILTANLAAQTIHERTEPFRIGPGVTAPRLVHKVQPEFSPQARRSRVQGTVILQIVISRDGLPTEISVLSPLGFGLDERAIAAVKQWKFTPGSKDGQPVKILATVEVNFRFPGIAFDDKQERQRSTYNQAVHTINQSSSSADAVERSVQSITALSKSKFTPAMYLIGWWRLRGEHGPQDTAEGLDLMQKAAAQKHAPAIYEIAHRRIDGRDLPRDPDKGLAEMREAAVLGSPPAQFYLASRYANGEGIAPDPQRARQYYRLCAAQRVAQCQYRLGRLLYDAPGRPERDYLHAIALFQLAAEQNLPESQALADSETPKLTDEQLRWVEKLKREIIQK